jgi:hypothetical protein
MTATKIASSQRRLDRTLIRPARPADLPDGQISKFLSSPLAKNIPLRH